MKNILVLGASGMAGHTIYKYLKLSGYNVISTARNDKYIKPDYYLDLTGNISKVKDIIDKEKIDVVINCIGLLVKECNEDLGKALYANGCFPHCLERITEKTKTKVIHLSTDCVFSGIKGNYSESDNPDETNNYGRCKRAGEIINRKDLTLRMSIIGNELKENGSGLFHWFINQEGRTSGYTRALWNGITTLELAKQIDRIIDTNLTGLYHLAPDFKISKYNLLKLIAEIFDKDIIIEKNENLIQDKTLVNNRKKEYDPKIPSYEKQLQEMKEFIG